MRWSLASGCLWAVIGFSIAWAWSPIRSGPFEVLRIFSGGLLAAPLIGMLVGVTSHRFSGFGFGMRVFVALASLYMAAWLFVVAAGVGVILLRGGGYNLGVVSGLLKGSLLQAVVGLTYSGFVLFLWPLSYLNHELVGRQWKQAARTRSS